MCSICVPSLQDRTYGSTLFPLFRDYRTQYWPEISTQQHVNTSFSHETTFYNSRGTAPLLRGKNYISQVKKNTPRPCKTKQPIDRLRHIVISSHPQLTTLNSPRNPRSTTKKGPNTNQDLIQQDNIKHKHCCYSNNPRNTGQVHKSLTTKCNTYSNVPY